MKISKILPFLFVIFIGMLIFFIGGYVVYYIYAEGAGNNNDCLVKLGEKICEEEGLFYKRITWSDNYQVKCVGNLRQEHPTQTFNLLKEEVQRCKK